MIVLAYRAIVCKVAKDSPYGHTRNGIGVFVKAAQVKLLTLENKHGYAVNCQYGVEHKRLNNSLGKRVHRMPHNPCRIDKVNKIR